MGRLGLGGSASASVRVALALLLNTSLCAHPVLVVRSESTSDSKAGSDQARMHALYDGQGTKGAPRSLPRRPPPGARCPNVCLAPAMCSAVALSGGPLPLPLALALALAARRAPPVARPGHRWRPYPHEPYDSLWPRWHWAPPRRPQPVAPWATPLSDTQACRPGTSAPAKSRIPTPALSQARGANSPPSVAPGSPQDPQGTKQQPQEPRRMFNKSNTSGRTLKLTMHWSSTTTGGAQAAKAALQVFLYCSAPKISSIRHGIAPSSDQQPASDRTHTAVPLPHACLAVRPLPLLSSCHAADTRHGGGTPPPAALPSDESVSTHLARQRWPSALAQGRALASGGAMRGAAHRASESCGGGAAAMVSSSASGSFCTQRNGAMYAHNACAAPRATVWFFERSRNSKRCFRVDSLRKDPRARRVHTSALRRFDRRHY